MYKLEKELISFPYISVKHQLDLFDKLIFPVLSYGSQVWGLPDSHLFENII